MDVFATDLPGEALDFVAVDMAGLSGFRKRGGLLIPNSSFSVNPQDADVAGAIDFKIHGQLAELSADVADQLFGVGQVAFVAGDNQLVTFVLIQRAAIHPVAFCVGPSTVQAPKRT